MFGANTAANNAQSMMKGIGEYKWNRKQVGRDNRRYKDFLDYRNNQIQYMKADAEKAGINPIYALGKGAIPGSQSPINVSPQEGTKTTPSNVDVIGGLSQMQQIARSKEETKRIGLQNRIMEEDNKIYKAFGMPYGIGNRDLALMFGAGAGAHSVIDKVKDWREDFADAQKMKAKERKAKYGTSKPLWLWSFKDIKDAREYMAKTKTNKTGVKK